MKTMQTQRDEAVTGDDASDRSLFGGPLTLRASFLLTVLFDFSLLAIVATIASLIWGF